MTQYNPEEKIFLTYKTRMTTEARLRRTNFISYVLLTWYSFSLIIFSLIDLSGKFYIANFSMVSAALSIATFAMSLFFYGERYAERADQFRNCYLKLQNLYESGANTPAKMRKYAEILDLYENQSDDDYDEMLFDAYLRGQKLENARGPVAISRITFAKVLLHRVIRTLFYLVIFTLPIAFGFFTIKPLLQR